MRTRIVALALALATCGPCAALIATPADAAKIVVSSRKDTVNGNTSSPAALKADPGPDGISLREAIIAANNRRGPHTITFARKLAGKSIAPSTVLPEITRDGISIVGLVDINGQPTVTLDASATDHPILLFIKASDFAVRSLRIVGLQVSHKKFGIFVRAGATFGQPGRRRIANIEIRGNVFDNDPGLTTGSLAISVGMEPSATDASLSSVLIKSNTFARFRGEANGIHVAAGGNNNVIKDVTIANNTFSDIEFPVELVAAKATNSRIIRSQIVANSFDTGLQPVNLAHFGPGPTPVDPAASLNLISDTLISGNVFRDNRGPAIVILGGMSGATQNAINNTRIINNLIAGSTQFGGVSTVGGRAGGTQNSIENVAVINNTVADSFGSGVGVDPNLDGGTGNTVSGVSVRNTIFWNIGQGGWSEVYGLPLDAVRYSIIAQAGFAGANHNKSFNPRFMNSAAGDYHLQPTSRAIGKGTSRKAPADDLDCRPRNVPPSIGAYEGNDPNICPAP